MNESVKVAMALKKTQKKPVGRPKKKMKASERPKKKMKASGRPKKKMKASGRSKKLCSWQMRWAMEAVMNGELGINRSAIQYGVPKTTVKNRISRRVQHGTNLKAQASSLFDPY